MTKDEMILLAKEAGWEYAHDDEGFEPLWAFAHLVAAFVASAEREEIAQFIEDSPTLVGFAQNDQGGCLMCGFTPKLAAKFIRTKAQAAINKATGETE